MVFVLLYLMRYIPGLIHYPNRFMSVTLAHKLSLLGVTIPTNLPRDLKLLLNINLNQLPQFNEEKWPDLIYYVLLFLEGYADITSALLHYTFIDQSSSNLWELKVLDRSHSDFIRLKYTKGSPEEIRIYDTTLPQLLRRQLQHKGLLRHHPTLLGLMCMENCPMLRALFIEVYRQQKPQSEQIQTFALKHVSNYFVLGEVHYDRDTSTNIVMSNADHITVDGLHKLASQHRNSPTFISSLVSLFYTSREHRPHMRAETIEQIFNTVRVQISDPGLRDSLTITTMDRIKKGYIINYYALADFIKQHSITAKNPHPDNHLLEDLFRVVCDKTIFAVIVKELAELKFFIDLDQTETLEQQLKTLDNNTTKITSELKALPRESLQAKWLTLQFETCKLFRDMVEEALDQSQIALSESLRVVL